MLTLEEFDKVEMRVGTVVKAKLNKRARTPAYGLTVDFGEEIGTKTSSAQITDLYQPDDLIGRQVVAVMNFSPIRIADVKSEVRLLGADTKEGCVLLAADQKVPNGNKIF